MTTPAAPPHADPAPGPPAPGRLPTAAWALAWSSVLAQVVAFADHGIKSDRGWTVVVSMLVGALVVWWFTAGVLTARTGRIVVTWVLLGVAVVVETIAVVDDALAGTVGIPLLHLVSSVVMLASLGWFTATSYYAWQRTRPRVSGPSRSGVLAVAVLVGLSAGVVDADPDAPLQVRVGG